MNWLKSLKEIIKRTSKVLEMDITDESALELAKRSRKTPRIANRLFKRVRDFAIVEGNGIIDLDICKKALDRLKIDKIGLDETDKELILTIIDKYCVLYEYAKYLSEKAMYKHVIKI